MRWTSSDEVVWMVISNLLTLESESEWVDVSFERPVRIGRGKMWWSKVRLRKVIGRSIRFVWALQSFWFVCSIDWLDFNLVSWIALQDLNLWWSSSRAWEEYVWWTQRWWKAVSRAYLIVIKPTKYDLSLSMVTDLRSWDWETILKSEIKT